MEPRVFEGRLVLTGLPDARKFADLAHDPRLCLHTAVVDSRVGDGDVKLFGSVVNMVNDRAQQRRFAAELYADTGFDLRGGEFRDYYAVEPIGASSVELIDGHLDITVWRPGAPERVVRTH